MITVPIRKQGGAAIMTIPANILKMLNIDIGTLLEVDVTKQGLIIRPARHKPRKRYSMTELLRGATPKTMKALNKKTAWAREGNSVGRELT